MPNNANGSYPATIYYSDIYRRQVTEVIDSLDIAGRTALRAAAKNLAASPGSVAALHDVYVFHSDFPRIIEEIRTEEPDLHKVGLGIIEGLDEYQNCLETNNGPIRWSRMLK